ncbi:multidrug effflux MFS transporter [Silvibacterium sp.]|uniref:multidrug effflux MFS transporter n=1 Tax=Silvibacterium sp. TaxID=1964179 RepID=UPI0039E622D4
MSAPPPHSARHPKWILVLLGALCVVTPFAIDMYLPAFSHIAREFHTETHDISLSLSSYFVGFAIGQLFYGPLLDRFGRKRPLYFGLIAYVVCSIGCAMAPSLHAFIALRVLEALGGCAAQVAAIAMVRDFFPVEQSARVFSLLFLMIGASPLLAPTIGSALMSGLGWRWIFIVLAAMAFVILVVTFFLLPEGHQPDTSVSLRLSPILANFWNIFVTPQFLVYTLAGSFSFAGLFTFVAGSPIVFMDGFHMGTKGFGITFAVLVMGFIGGNNLNVFLLKKFNSQQIFLAALSAQTILGTAFLAGALAHVLDLRGMMALFFLYLTCIGFTYPNGAAIALAPFSRDAGSASAMFGSVQTGIGAIISMSIGFLGAQAVIGIMAGTAIVALLSLLIGRRSVGELIVGEDGPVAVAH